MRELPPRRPVRADDGWDRRVAAAPRAREAARVRDGEEGRDSFGRRYRQCFLSVSCCPGVDESRGGIHADCFGSRGNGDRGRRGHRWVVVVVVTVVGGEVVDDVDGPAAGEDVQAPTRDPTASRGAQRLGERSTCSANYSSVCSAMIDARVATRVTGRHGGASTCARKRGTHLESNRRAGHPSRDKSRHLLKGPLTPCTKFSV